MTVKTRKKLPATKVSVEAPAAPPVASSEVPAPTLPEVPAPAPVDPAKAPSPTAKGMEILKANLNEMFGPPSPKKKAKTVLGNGVDPATNQNCAKAIADQAKDAPTKVEKLKSDAIAKKTKREAYAAKKSGAGVRSKLDGATVEIINGNPKKEGTKGWDSLEVLIAAGGKMSFEDYIAKGGRRKDTLWDIKNGLVRLVD